MISHFALAEEKKGSFQIECLHEYFDTATNSCLKCGLIDSLKDEYEVCQNFYKENDYYTFHTKKPQIGLKKYSKKEREIEEYYKQLKKGSEEEEEEIETATTVSLLQSRAAAHPPSCSSSSLYGNDEQDGDNNNNNKAIIQQSSVTTTAKKTIGFIITDEKYYIPNLKNKFLYIKSKEYNFKESSFENFYTIYKTIILDIPGNEDCVIGDKFYLNNTEKICYSEPCYIFQEENKELLSFDSKILIKEKYTRNVNFLKKIYLKYRNYIEKSSSFISEDKKRNKSKSYIECFVMCILIHYYIFHCKEEEGDNDNFSPSHKSSKKDIIENCFGIKYSTTTTSSSQMTAKLSFKKKKIKSHIFSLIDLFNVNEVTMQTHLNDIVHNIV